MNSTEGLGSLFDSRIRPIRPAGAIYNVKPILAHEGVNHEIISLLSRFGVNCLLALLDQLEA